jgi:putative MATE family efflux protein
MAGGTRSDDDAALADDGTPVAAAQAFATLGTTATAATGEQLGVWQLAWPTIVSNLLISAVGFIDIKIVGALGAPAVAAITTGTRVFFVIQAVLMAITAGTTALVARAWGAGDHDEAARVTWMSLWLCAGIGLVLTLAGMAYADTIAGVFRLEPETVALAATFIRWLSAFNVAFALYAVLNTALRAAGDAVTPLCIGALTNVVSVSAAYSLVYGKFGMPALGVAGAAIGNGTAFLVGAVLITALWLRGSLLVGTGRAGALRLDRVRRIVHIGYPAGLEQLASQGGYVAFLWIIALYGTAPYAAYGIGVNILSFSFVVGFGFSIAASTLVGQHLGARDPDGATRQGWRAMGLSIAVMLAFGGLIVGAAEPIAAFLIDDSEVIRLTVAFIHVLGSVQALMAIEFSLGGALRGAGDTRFPFLTALVGLFGVRVALAAFFVWRGLSAEWVFSALIADYIVKATMLTLRFRTGRWKTVIPW